MRKLGTRASNLRVASAARLHDATAKLTVGRLPLESRRTCTVVTAVGPGVAIVLGIETACCRVELEYRLLNYVIPT